MSQADELLLLLSLYQKKYGTLAASTVELIKKYLSEGYSPEKAIQLALNGSNFFAINEEYIADTTVSAAMLGYGVSDKVKVNTNGIRKAMLNEVWASDEMSLSHRLHGHRADIRQNIVDAISVAMKRGDSWQSAARNLYDGYSAGHITKRVELPKYLQELSYQAKRVLAGDKRAMDKYEAAINKAEYQINKLAKDGTPTREMKQAFKNLVDAAKKLNAEALNKAISVAVEEKSRYIADRIARTEISRAWGDGFFARYQDNPDVIAYRWRLSSRHPVYDICDIYADVDCYGLGKGVFPKDKFPKRPAHPHCMCLITPVYVGEIDMDEQKESDLLSHAKFNSDAVSQYISGLSRQQQMSLLGVEGLKQFEKDGTWENSLRLWQGHEKPSTRLKKEDFTGPLNKQELSKLFTSENVIIPEDKILGYSLNKEHPSGGDKAVVFDKVLGYNENNYQELIQSIKSAVDKFPAKSKGQNPYGQLYEVVMDITGPTGRMAPVTTGWILETDSLSPRLTSAYIKSKKKGEKK